MKNLYLLLGLALLSICTYAGDGKQYKSGLVAHYYMDPQNWGGKWPDDASVPNANPAEWTFKEYKYSRVEPVINHQFINKGWFSVRWVGYFDPAGRETGELKKDAAAEDGKAGKKKKEPTPSGGTYVFQILADDGCRLSIDGEVLIDDWKACDGASPDAIRKSKPVQLADGKHKIVVEYFQGQSLKQGDKDPIKLYWSTGKEKEKPQLVSASHFSHSSDDTKAPDTKN